MTFIFSVPNFGCCLSCISRMKSRLHSLVCFSNGLCGACVPKNKWFLMGSFCYGFTIPALLCWIFVSHLHSSVWLDFVLLHEFILSSHHWSHCCSKSCIPLIMVHCTLCSVSITQYSFMQSSRLRCWVDLYHVLSQKTLCLMLWTSTPVDIHG